MKAGKCVYCEVCPCVGLKNVKDIDICFLLAKILA